MPDPWIEAAFARAKAAFEKEADSRCFPIVLSLTQEQIDILGALIYDYELEYGRGYDNPTPVYDKLVNAASMAGADIP